MAGPSLGDAVITVTGDLGPLRSDVAGIGKTAFKPLVAGAESAGKQAGASISKPLANAGKTSGGLFSSLFSRSAEGATSGLASKLASGSLRAGRSAGHGAGSELAKGIASGSQDGSRRAESELSKAGESAGRGFGSHFTDTMKGVFTGGALLGVVSRFAGAITGEMGEAINQSDATDKFKQTLQFAGQGQASIKALTKSAQDYADRTVYNLADIQNATAQLTANGIKNSDTLVKSMGNLNAVAGGNADTFQSVGMVLTQTAGAGKLTTENWNQLADAIPGASGILQAQMKKNGAFTGNFRDAMAAGQITAEEFSKAIQQTGSTKAAAEAATSTKTIEGAWGNLQAGITGGLSKIVTALKPFITGGMNVLSGWIGKATDAIGPFLDKVSDLGKPSGGLAGMMTLLHGGSAGGGGFLASLMPLIQAISPLGGIVKGMLPALSQMGNAWKTIGVTAGQLVAQLVPALLPAFVSLAKLFSGALATVLPVVSDMLAQLATTLFPILVHVVQLLLPLFMQLVSTLLPVLVSLFGSLAKNVFPVLVQVVGALLPIIAQLVSAVLPILVQLFVALVPVLTPVITILAQLAKAVLPLLVGVLNILVPVLTFLVKVLATVVTAVVRGITWFLNLGSASKTVHRAFLSLVNWIAKVFMVFFTKMIPDAFRATINWVTSKWPAIKNILLWPIRAARQLIHDDIQEVRSIFTSVKNWATGVFDKAWSAVKHTFTAPIVSTKNWLVTTLGAGGPVRGIFNSVKNWVTNIFAREWAGLKLLFTDPVRYAKNVIATILGKTGLQKVFSNAVSAIGRIWGKIKSTVAAPVKWIIDNVINKGILRGINTVLRFVGLGKQQISWISTAGFYTGTTNTGGNPRDVRGVVHGQEAVIPHQQRGALEAALPGGLDTLVRTGKWPVGPAAETSGARVNTPPGSGVPVGLSGIPTDLRQVVLRGPRPGDQGIGAVNPIAFADREVGQMGWYNRCLAFVNAAWDYSVARFRLATARQSANAGPRTMAGVAPAGAAGYWDTGPAGHVALSAGDGTYFSNDVIKPGMISRVGKSVIDRWGPFMGWWNPAGNKGVWGAITSKISAGAADLAQVLNPAKVITGAVTKALSGISQFGDNPMVRMLTQVPKTLASKAVDWAKDKLSLFGGSSPAGSGVDRWAGTVRQALQLNHLPTSAPYVQAWLRQIGTESGGNPNAVQGNIGDINNLTGQLARGLVQVIPSTFAAYHLPGLDNIMAGLDNLAAGMNYAKHRYPNMLSVIGHGHGYDNGGWLPPGLSLNYNGTHRKEPNPVFTTQQWDTLQRLANGGSGGRTMKLVSGEIDVKLDKAVIRNGVVEIMDEEGNRI